MPAFRMAVIKNVFQDRPSQPYASPPAIAPTPAIKPYRHADPAQPSLRALLSTPGPQVRLDHP
ncbi:MULTISPECIES: hypothetical protein [unclassified Janthinobacterium]|uniref:hypothetical protein n=1 Tax=unclassified Janthinobacterium TaxID=2610881 RepID=UPI001614404D|nr:MULTISPECIES: hypothetical protein [unclassified Janthinobacterium]MBB5609220.1 hypothetical protein [Janthinobacterium sp. S3T4]MBB5614393.1 hypothetical protein [Janthinobacterium sp. S3M3]